MADLVAILASVITVSLVAFVGIIFIGLQEAFLKRIVMALVGFASGSLIGGAFIHLLPESLEKSGQVMFYYVIVGMSSSSSWKNSCGGDTVTKKHAQFTSSHMSI